MCHYKDWFTYSQERILVESTLLRLTPVCCCILFPICRSYTPPLVPHYTCLHPPVSLHRYHSQLDRVNNYTLIQVRIPSNMEYIPGWHCTIPWRVEPNTKSVLHTHVALSVTTPAQSCTLFSVPLHFIEILKNLSVGEVLQAPPHVTGTACMVGV